ncbi:DNA repair protein RadC [Sinobacterium caligoides]|uniref:DNA repair protein RadC n=1 Tax=Sinobacterium caligoides TaxID=933926 RepID=A0A3N2DH38_9GAMM|nr:DNA repair protein RadC [Sinobacterium caligoides]ROR99103.1 DNA repair protein RadC [Sinobacterium caligoides]
MAIVNWTAAQRPREKLLFGGAASLSDAELLAILLRTGVAGCSAVELAQLMLRRFGGLRAVLRADQQACCQIKGVSEAKFVQIQVVTELSKRAMAEAMCTEGVLSSSYATKEYLRLYLRETEYEVFVVMFLTNAHAVIATEEMFQGTIDGASVYPREVVKRGLHHNAAAIICAHNHPSGTPEPSEADIRITLRLKSALDLVGISVLDHMVVGDMEVVSLAERGVI